MRLLWQFFQRFLRFKRPLTLGILCIPLAQLADIGVTLTIGSAIDGLEGATDRGFLVGLLALLAILALVHSVFRYFQRWLIVVVSRRFEVELKQDLFDKLTSLSFDFHNKSRSRDIVSRLTSDVENLRMFLGPGLMYSLGAVVIVPISIGLLFTMEPALALTMVLPMVLMGLAMKAFSPQLHRYSVAVQESLADISHRAQENFAGIRVVKGYNREDQQARLFGETSETNRVNQIRLASVRGKTHAAIHLANNLTFVAILVIGGMGLVDRNLTNGDLLIFIDLTFKVFWPLIALGWIAGMAPRALASAQRVDELLRTESDIQEPRVPDPRDTFEGALELEGVGYTYAGAERPALSGVDLTIPAGSTVGIVGPTGSGKSTLLNLIGRLFDAEGEIRLDGVPIRNLRLPALRGALGYVPQDSFLFSETYADNIRFGADEDLDEPELRRLIDRACMTEEVAEFPQDIETLIGERGVSLSGGQRQRTCIARALARDPRILVLDDCLSAVDTETERRLIAHLREEGESRTVILAAHRLNTVRDSDQILVLDENGAVEDLGTHDELVQKDGWYGRTWAQQQRQEELSEL